MLLEPFKKEYRRFQGYTFLMAPSINMVPPTRSVPFQVGTHEIEGNTKRQGAIFYNVMGKCDEISRIFSIIITVCLRGLPLEKDLS